MAVEEQSVKRALSDPSTLESITYRANLQNRSSFHLASETFLWFHGISGYTVVFGMIVIQNHFDPVCRVSVS